MKKVLLGLAALLFLSSISTSMVLAESELMDPIILPLKDDSGQNWILQNENAKYRLKWSISSDSQYDHFNARKVNEQTVILHNFSEVFAVNDNGQVLWKQKDASRELEVGADGSLFTATNDFAFLDETKTTSKSSITRFDKNGNIIKQYEDLTFALVRGGKSRFIADMFYSVDWKGNLIALLENGLSALDRDGKMKWQLKELKVKDKNYDVFKINFLTSDNKGNLLVAVDNELICLNDEGEVVWGRSMDLSKSKMKMSGNYLVVGETIYTVTRTGLTEETNPEIAFALSGRPIDHHGGYYQVDEKTSSLSNNKFQSSNAIWSYTLSASERSAGYHMAGNYNQNLVSDDQGNVYVSTNGGTIHSLDNQGNSRFTLEITNKIIGYSQIIPLSENKIVITNNRNVICLEKVDEKQSGISLWLNGKEQSLQHKLIMQDGRVMISLREVFEMLGAQVTWNQENYQITAERDVRKIIMQIGSKEASFNGITTSIDTAPALIDDVTFVPLRFVTEALGSKVEWDDENKIVRIMN